MSKRSRRIKRRRGKRNACSPYVPYSTIYSPPPEFGEYIAWKKAALCEKQIYKCSTTSLFRRLLDWLKIRPLPMHTDRHFIKDVIVKLRIPTTAKRVSPEGYKCRASCAYVLEFQDMHGNPLEVYPGSNFIVCSQFLKTFEYKLGEWVYPTKEFDDNPNEECSTGIHHFMNRIDAVNYGRV